MWQFSICRGNPTPISTHNLLKVFDPHEPFDCPQRYRERYGDRWDGYHFTWPLSGTHVVEGQESHKKRVGSVGISHVVPVCNGLVRLIDQMEHVLRKNRCDMS